MLQERFWLELCQLKAYIFYLENHLEKIVTLDWRFNMALSVMSTGSIAGWAVFNSAAFMWGLIIATSQVLSSMKSYLPFIRQLKSLTAISNDLDTLFLEMENEWFNISTGKLTEGQIHKSLKYFKTKKHSIIQKHLCASPLPKDDALMEKARQDAHLYFTTFHTTEMPGI